MQPERFADKGHTLYDFATHFEVNCPKCHGRALVRQGDHRLSCTACFHNEMPGRWYGLSRLSVVRRCPECGNHGRRYVETDVVHAQIPLRCEHCGDERLYDASVERLLYRDGLKVDPVYGLPLRLQANFRDELFWAWNREHLAYLRSYIGASLRERGIEPRNSIRKSSSMVSRLPAFMSKAGNRDELLRLIGKLEDL